MRHSADVERIPRTEPDAMPPTSSALGVDGLLLHPHRESLPLTLSSWQ
ncbi:hypothetical protein ACPPVQ_08425 [Diaminobutyricibacter sp. McL0618]